MTPFPYTVEITQTLEEARELMAEHDLRHLPVSEDEELLGVVSDRDIKWALDPVVDFGADKRLKVEDILRKDPYVVDLNTNLEVVLEEMIKRKIGSVLVTKNGRLAGIFTTSDACAAYLKLLRELGGTHPDDEVA